MYKKDEFLGVHYRAQVAFNLRPANASPPGAGVLGKLARESEEADLITEDDWFRQFLQDWCQGNKEHRLVLRKPALVPWRSWYLRCIHFDLGVGDVLNKRWRQFLREMSWEQLTPLQRLAFDGSLHLIKPMVKQAQEEGKPNPFLAEKNVLFYVVLSRSIDTLSFMLENGFGTADQLRVGESWTGFTALHAAVFIQHREMVSLLWNQYKANVHVKDLFFGSVLDYCRLLGLVTNAEVYFRGDVNEGFAFGYKTFEHVVQLTLRHPYSWDAPEKDQFELRNVRTSDKVYIPYWNKKSRVLERMPLEEWTDLVRCVYQPYISSKDSWLDELMFNGAYVSDPTPELRKRYAAHLKNLQTFETPQHVVMSYINARIGFACYAAHDLARGDYITNYTGWMHSDRYKWKDVEKTTQFRLNFMKQIHDLGEKGEGIIRKQHLPRYARNPNFNLAVPGTIFFVNSTECGNMGRVINHSTNPNAQLVMIWNAGVPQVLVIALKDIVKGEQILVDYEQFWQYFEMKKAERAAKKPEKLSLWNYNDDEAYLTREQRGFFTGEDMIEMTNYKGFPMFIDLDGAASVAPSGEEEE